MKKKQAGDYPTCLDRMNFQQKVRSSPLFSEIYEIHRKLFGFYYSTLVPLLYFESPILLEGKDEKEAIDLCTWEYFSAF